MITTPWRLTKHLALITLTLVYLSLLNISCTESNRVTKKPVSEKLVWSDEFNYAGLPDSAKWSYDVGGSGWGNQELEYYTQSDTNNAVVRDGMLHIFARKNNSADNAYTSARLTTKNKGDWTSGTIEVKARLPKGRGLWPAIWMLPTDWAYGGWPASGEIDIMEHVGWMPDSLFFTVHTKAFNHVLHTQVGKSIFLQNLYDAFHVFTIHWNDKHIDFLLDNQTVFTYKNSGKGFEEWPFDKKFHLLLNLAVGGAWGGVQGVDTEIFPAEFQIDYVRVYQ